MIDPVRGNKGDEVGYKVLSIETGRKAEKREDRHNEGNLIRNCHASIVPPLKNRLSHPCIVYVDKLHLLVPVPFVSRLMLACN